MMNVTLQSKRLVLRPWRFDDFEPLAAFYGNEKMMAFSSRHCDRAGAWTRFCSMIGEWTLRGFGTFALEERTSGHLVGYSGLWYPIQLDEPELCWSLFETAHGKGFATEAAKRVQIWARDALQLGPLMSFVHPDNFASQKVAERLGAQREGEGQLRGEPRFIYRHILPDTKTDDD